jgi:hypothetical protein
MKTLAILGLVVAVAVVALLLSMSDAWAQPVAGAYYGGDITGCAEPPCGTVSFTVSESGSQVENFTAYNVPGDACVFMSFTYPVPLDIEDDSFGPGIEGIYEVSGTFLSEGNAEGTLKLVTSDPPCETDDLAWTAVTTTPPPAPVGGMAELPDVADSAAGGHSALAGLVAVALAALAAGTWWARRWWLS